MTGDQLKTALVERGINLSGVARKMRTSPQALNARFKNDDLKYSFVKRVVEAAGYQLAQFLVEVEGGGNINDPGGAGPYSEDFRTKYFVCLEEKAALLQKLVHMQEVMYSIPVTAAPADASAEKGTDTASA